MARKIIHQLIDDLDGTALEPGSGDTVHFSLDGTAYEIDLTESNAAALRAVLEPYVAAGRRLSRGGGSTSPAPRRSAPTRDLAAVREWANSNGYTVSDRGRVPAVVLDAFDAAH